MENEHLLNILKIISVDDYDECIAAKIYDYLESRKIINIGGENHKHDVSAYDLAKLESLLANTHLTTDSASPYEYVAVLQSPPSH